MTAKRRVAALPATATLVVIDVQKAIDAAYWAKEGPRNNPGADAILAALE